MAEDGGSQSSAPQRADRIPAHLLQQGTAPEELLASTDTPLYSPSLLGNPALDGRGNAPVKIALMTQMQQAYGNKAVQRFLRRTSVGTRVVVQRQPMPQPQTPAPPQPAPPATTPSALDLPELPEEDARFAHDVEENPPFAGLSQVEAWSRRAAEAWADTMVTRPAAEQLEALRNMAGYQQQHRVIRNESPAAATERVNQARSGVTPIDTSNAATHRTRLVDARLAWLAFDFWREARAAAARIDRAEVPARPASHGHRARPGREADYLRVITFARHWMMTRREQILFLRDMPRLASVNVPAGPMGAPDAVLMSDERVGHEEGGQRVHPFAVHFLRRLRARQSGGWSASTYVGHNIQQVDISLGQVDPDTRFYRAQDAITFLNNVHATAGELRCEWRAIYNQFSIARQINQSTHANHVIYRADLDNHHRLNWHGTLNLHIHLDLSIPSGWTPPQNAAAQ